MTTRSARRKPETAAPLPQQAAAPASADLPPGHVQIPAGEYPVVLPVEAWNVVLAGLRKLPMEVAEAPVGAIREQVSAEAARRATAKAKEA